jgi:hypothetical protein
VKEIYTPFKPPFKYDANGIFILDSDGNCILDIRGWGFLTGANGMDYGSEQAAIIQDRIGERVAQLMNEDVKS